MSTFENLNRETITYNYDSLDNTIPTPDEIIYSLSELRGDFGKLSTLIIQEDRIVDDLLQVMLKLTKILQWLPVESSILPKNLDEVESAYVTPKGALIVCCINGKIETIDLFEYENRDLLVDVVRDLEPKLRWFLKRSSKPIKSVKEELESIVKNPFIEDLEIEMPVIEEPILKEEAEIEDIFMKAILEKESVFKQPELDLEDAEELENIISESVKPVVIRSSDMEKLSIEKSQISKEPIKKKPQRVRAKDRNIDPLWAVLIGLRKDSLQEIKAYRMKRERENGMLLRSIRKKLDQEVVNQRDFFEKVKRLLIRRIEKKD